VNHTWLEDCFIQWKTLSVGSAGGKYIEFPPGTDFSAVLGERGPGRVVLGDLEREEEVLGVGAGGEGVGMGEDGEMVAVAVNGVKVLAPKWKESTGAPPPEGKGKGKERMQSAAHSSSKEKPNTVTTAPTKKPGSGGEQPIGTGNSAREAREVEEVVGIGAFDGDANGDVMEVDDEDGVGMGVDEEGGSPPKVKKKKPAKQERRREDDEVVFVPSKGSKSKNEKAKARSRVEVVLAKVLKSKTKQKATRRVDEDEEDEDEVRPLEGLKSKREKAKKGADSEEEEEERHVALVSGSKSKTQEKAKKTPHDDDSGEEEVEEKIERPKSRLIRRARKDIEKDEPKSSTSKGQVKHKHTVVFPDMDDDSDDPDFDAHITVQSGMKAPPAKVKTKVKTKPTSPHPPPSDDPDEEVVVLSKKPTRTLVSKGKGKKVDTTEDEDDDDNEDQCKEFPATKKLARSTAASNGKAKEIDAASPVRIPKHVVSVVMLMPVHNNGGSGSGSKNKHSAAPPTRTESLRIEAAEVAGHSSPKRARPAKGSRGGPVLDSHSGGGAMRRPVDIGDNVTSASLPRKRSAAIKASNHLHNVMMPDLLNYTQEKKRGFKGKESDRISAGDRSWESSAAAGKGRKRPSDASADRQSSDEGERKRKRKISVGGGPKNVAQVESENEGEEEEVRPRKVAKKVRVVSYDGGKDHAAGEKVDKGKRWANRFFIKMITRQLTSSAIYSSTDKNRTSKTDSVFVMTTQVHLSDDVVKVSLLRFICD
jgi:hypothetical protein